MKRYILIAIIGLFAWAANAQKRAEVEKNISEKYAVTAGDKLSIFNKYGDVTVNTWNKNEITVDIAIKAWAKDEDEAEELLERISVEYGKSGDQISFETKLASTKWVNNNNKSGFQINYTVNMPTKNELLLTNKYGAVNLADFAGVLNLEVGYGELLAGALTGEQVEVTLKYSKGKIESVERGSLEFRYSSNITIERVGDVSLSDKYGGVTINEANSIDAAIAYSGLKIGTLRHSLMLDAKYSSGSIAQLQNGFEKVEVETAYGSFSMGVDNAASFDFMVETKYGSFKSNANLDITKQIERNSAGSYEGSMGTGKKGSVKVASAYGSVKFQ